MDKAKDKEATEQDHELHCFVQIIKFTQRTIFSCNCRSKEIYKKEFLKRRNPKDNE